MGWCHEFGVQIHAGCGHPMQANTDSCICIECGTVCHGHFGGCPDVWARGPIPVTMIATPSATIPDAGVSTSVKILAPESSPYAPEPDDDAFRVTPVVAPVEAPRSAAPIV